MDSLLAEGDAGCMHASGRLPCRDLAQLITLCDPPALCFSTMLPPGVEDTRPLECAASSPEAARASLHLNSEEEDIVFSNRCQRERQRPDQDRGACPPGRGRECVLAAAPRELMYAWTRPHTPWSTQYFSVRASR